jgi:hypothetical protein
MRVLSNKRAHAYLKNKFVALVTNKKHVSAEIPQCEMIKIN